MYKNTIIFVVTFLTSLSLFAQNGTLKGTVTDAVTGETIPMANIVIKSDGLTILGGASDFDGNFTIKPITPGTYTVEVSFIGYATLRQTNVLISPDKITFSDYKMSLEANILTEVEIIEYDVPLIDADKSGSTKTKEQITALPTRSVQNVAATTAGVYQGDTGGALNVRGSRSDATAYYVDGVKIVGSTNILPQAAIDQMTVVTGGVPAQYGDATGGIISIVTSGPSRITRAGMEIQTSKFLDPYNWNLAAFNLSGPIWRKKDEDRTPILSYLITSEYNYKGDYDPSAIGVPVLNDGVLESLQQSPSQFFINDYANGQPSYLDPDATYNLNSADTLGANSWTIGDTYQTKSSQNLKLQAKFTLAVTKDIDFIIGGNSQMSGFYDGSWANQLLNSDNNYYTKSISNNIYTRIQHRLSGDDGGAVKNLFYTLQADYSSYARTIEHEDHGKNYWLYNYVGKFTREIDNETLTNFGAQIPQTWSEYDVYVLDEDGNRIQDSNGDWLMETHTGVLVQNYETLGFEASDANPILANYTQQYYDWLDQNADDIGAFDANGNPIGDGIADWKPSLVHVANNALINGQSPGGINSLWYNVGLPMGIYLEQSDNRRRFTGSASADIGNHAISFGFEYEKKTDRYYRLYTDALWSRARQLANRHLLGFEEYIIDDELQNSHPNGDDVLLISEVYYQSEDVETYSTFGKNIREQLGLGVNDLVFVEGLNPEDLSLGMFSADEIFDQDDDVLYYYGYDHIGNKVNEPVSFDDFLNETDENGDYIRRVGPFQPLYSAAYIQDKFSLDDIVFNVGLRIDRYDANQQVLIDKYSLYPTITKSELAGQVPTLADYEHPENIGEDYVVYANSITDQTVIMGYRDGDDWYDAEGTQVTDPNALDAGIGVTPFLVNPDHNSEENYGLTEDAFEDYTPQISVMPRISFNFPISDEAMFFAHYDILTKRPSSSNRTNPFDYLFLASNAGGIANGNLKPEKTTDYEVGFMQALTKSSAVTISAFYRELDDLIQMTRVAAAYPMPYNHFDNIDFGTVKGLSFVYDLRRTNNVQLTATYTLQFADGTGSSSTTAETLINNGFPNLRTTLPLDFDQRHNISTNIDYRFGFGSGYNGPIIFGRQLLEGVGANLLIAAGSGTPYSQQTEATEEAKYGIPIRTTLEGSVNGARKPWTFRADLRVNKDIKIKMSEDRDLRMDVYMLVENLFNAANVMSVYRYTGNPDDDGYLSSTTGQDDALENALDPMAFYDQYSLKVNNPNNYARPRLIKLGMKVNF